jgi:ribosomal protein L11 methyltransferase
VEISLPVDGELAEAVCELFERYGGGAVVELRVRAAPEDGHDLAVPETRVRTYLPADDVEARARLEVGLWHLGQIHPLPEAEVRRLTEANWAEAWKAHYTPQHIGDHFLVVPSWLADEAAAAPEDVVLYLDPGTAFGTGLHPTTRLCLAALEELVRPGDAVLDLGTGSGILAIGAARLGAARVVAVDLDPKAAAVAADNAERNGVAIETRAGELADTPPGRFDVVVANILAGPIVALAPALVERLRRPGGRLVVSGILAEQAGDVAAALAAAGAEGLETRHSGDWVAIVAGPAEGAAG